MAKELLGRYGGAYLATSITLAVISFSICYLLVDNGVDVPALLQAVSAGAAEGWLRDGVLNARAMWIQQSARMLGKLMACLISCCLVPLLRRWVLR